VGPGSEIGPATATPEQITIIRTNSTCSTQIKAYVHANQETGLQFIMLFYNQNCIPAI